MQSHNSHNTQHTASVENHGLLLATDITLAGLQAALSLFQDVAGNIGVPALQTGVRAVSTVLQAIQVGNNFEPEQVCILITVHKTAISRQCRWFRDPQRTRSKISTTPRRSMFSCTWGKNTRRHETQSKLRCIVSLYISGT